MAAPAKVSKKCFNFQIRKFKEKFHFNIAANMTFITMVSFIIFIFLIVRTAGVACVERHTDIHTYCTYIQDNYCNPRCACTPRVNYHCYTYSENNIIYSECFIVKVLTCAGCCATIYESTKYPINI